MELAKILKLDMELDRTQKITDSKLIAKLQLSIKDVVAGESELNQEWIKAYGWVVIPVESGMTFRDAEWLSNACLKFGYKECFAIATEAEPFYQAYKFLTTKKGILEISYECRPNHYLLMPEDRRFAILCPFGLYSLVAGSKEFVEMAVGSTIETAREMFWEFAADTSWQESDRLFLTQLARKYQSLSAR